MGLVKVVVDGVSRVVDLGSENVPAGDMAGTLDMSNFIPNPGIGWCRWVQKSSAVTHFEAVEYARWYWDQIQTGPGVFNWSVIDGHIASAVAAGKQVAFRVMPHGGEGYGDGIPSWVAAGYTYSGTSYAPCEIVADSRGDLIPRYSDKTYLHAWGLLTAALAARYDGNPDVAWVEVSGYGPWGEWGPRDQTQSADTLSPATTSDGQARIQLMRMMLGGSGTTTVTRSTGGTESLSHSYAGFGHTQVLMNYAGSDRSVQYALQNWEECGFRNDNLNYTDNIAWSAILGAEADVWQRLVCVSEPGSSTASNSATRQRIRGNLVGGHFSFMNNTSLNGPTDEHVREMLWNIGYRYGLTAAAWNPEISGGQEWAPSFTIRNDGTAPNYPRTGNAFTVKVGLRDSAGIVVHEWGLEEDTTTWRPADPVTVPGPVRTFSESLTVPVDLDAGLYGVTFGVLCDRTGQFIKLCNVAPGVHADGRLAIGSVLAA